MFVAIHRHWQWHPSLWLYSRSIYRVFFKWIIISSSNNNNCTRRFHWTMTHCFIQNCLQCHWFFLSSLLFTAIRYICECVYHVEMIVLVCMYIYLYVFEFECVCVCVSKSVSNAFIRPYDKFIFQPVIVHTDFIPVLKMVIEWIFDFRSTQFIHRTFSSCDEIE